MRYSLNTFLLFILCVPPVFAGPDLRTGAILLKGDVGYGLVSPGAAGEKEAELADQENWDFTFIQPSTGETFNELYRYFYRGFLLDLSGLYFFKPNLAAGFSYKYKNILQKALMELEIDQNFDGALIALSCYAPQVMLVKPYHRISLFCCAELGLAVGEITRLPVRYNHMKDYIVNLKEVHAPRKAGGVCLALEGGLFEMIHGGFIGGLSLSYDLVYLKIEEDPGNVVYTVGTTRIEYVQRTLAQTIGLTFTFGFSPHIRTDSVKQP